MSSSILNNFKRVRRNDESETSSKRQKHEETDRSSTDRQPQKAITKFAIPPPDFNIDYSGSPGRIIKKDPDLDLVLFKPFLSKSSAKALYRYLLSSLPWYKV